MPIKTISGIFFHSPHDRIIMMLGGTRSNRMTSAQYLARIAKPAPLVSEKQIECAILEYLQLINITAWKQNSGCLKVENRFVRFATDARGRSVKGISDIPGYLPGGRALYIEVKRPGKYPTPDQKAFLKNAKESGCLAFVARSVQDVTDRLVKEGYLPPGWQPRT